MEALKKKMPHNIQMPLSLSVTVISADWLHYKISSQ